MKKPIRLLLYLVLGLGLLFATGLGAASWWIMRKMGPDMWVQQAENAWNCRAQIDDAELSLFTKPASLTFKGLRLAPRDAQVALPYHQRTPLAEGTAPIYIPEAIMEVKLEDLLERRLNIQRLRFVKPQVREFTTPEGKSSLESLFKKPGAMQEVVVPADATAAGAEAPLPANAAVLSANASVITPTATASNLPPPAAADSTSAVAVVEPSPAPTSDAAPQYSKEPFKVDVKEAFIEQGSMQIINGTTTVAISDLDFSLTDIDIDPLAPDKRNQMRAKLASHIQVTGLARISGAEQKAQLVDLQVNGEGAVTPLDIKGEWNPSTALRITLAKGSTLAGYQTIGDAAGNDLRKLEEYGIDLSQVPIGGTLMQDAVVEGLFRENQFATRSLTLFVFPQYEVAIEPNSWVNSAQDQHHLQFRLSCGPELQARLEAGIASKKLGDNLARSVVKAFADERGRLTFDIVSSGSLSDPKVKPSVDRVLKNLLRGEGLGDLLKGLFKKL